MINFQITFKDPDAMHDSIREAARNSVETIEGVTEQEREELAESREQAIGDALEAWVQYGETITIQFQVDLDQGQSTAKVVRQ